MACIGRGGVGVQWQGVDGVVEMGAWDVGEAVSRLPYQQGGVRVVTCTVSRRRYTGTVVSLLLSLGHLCGLQSYQWYRLLPTGAPASS